MSCRHEPAGWHGIASSPVVIRASGCLPQDHPQTIRDGEEQQTVKKTTLPRRSKNVMLELGSLSRENRRYQTFLYNVSKVDPKII